MPLMTSRIAKKTKINRSNVPLLIKLIYSSFFIVLAVFYLRFYGPTNFLFFCDVALIFTFLAVWSNKSLLASASLVGIFLPQLFWIVDFVSSLIGFPLIGMTSYMFDPVIPIFMRALSFFHFWLPLFLLWLVSRLGYDRRAFKLWTILAWSLMIVCYFFMPAPPAPLDNLALPVNINYVFGPSDNHAQDWMHPHLYFFMMMVLLPMAVFWPTHVFMSKLFPSPLVQRQSVGRKKNMRRRKRK